MYGSPPENTTMSSESNLFYEEALDAQRLAADSFARSMALKRSGKPACAVPVPTAPGTPPSAPAAQRPPQGREQPAER